jgi:23S rRNA pseudouridine955/2504/2580 synthase
MSGRGQTSSKVDRPLHPAPNKVRRRLANSSQPSPLSGRREQGEGGGVVDPSLLKSAGGETATVSKGEGILRLDRWFRRHYPALGHGRLEKLLRTGQIRVDGKRAKAGDRVAPGQAIRVPPFDHPETPADAVPRPISAADKAMLESAILHRDDHVLVLDKPPGLAVQGGTRSERHLDGLLDALRFGLADRPRLVHRLDKDTSGVLVIARTPAAAAFLTRAFRDKRTRKIYWALAVGRPKPAEGRIELALAKQPGPGGERVRADPEGGRHAVTYYRVIDSAGEHACWLALLPVTGRTHQLRAHCAAIGTPILGDPKYGGPATQLSGVPNARRLHLHARELSIPHPAGGMLKISASLPPHMRQSWQFFGFAGDAEDPFAALESAE